jgi:hypothetical protein
MPLLLLLLQAVTCLPPLGLLFVFTTYAGYAFVHSLVTATLLTTPSSHLLLLALLLHLLLL